MDASFFDSALSHTRRSDASEKREENSPRLYRLKQFLAWDGPWTLGSNTGPGDDIQTGDFQVSYHLRIKSSTFKVRLNFLNMSYQGWNYSRSKTHLRRYHGAWIYRKSCEKMWHAVHGATFLRTMGKHS